MVFSIHHLCRQALQKLWLQDGTTGSLKISWQTGQDRSSDLDHIFFLNEREDRKLSEFSGSYFHFRVAARLD